MQGYGGSPPGGYPPGNAGYPGGAPGYPPPARGAPPPGQRVEVKVSYGARMGVAIAIGTVILLFSAYLFGSYFLSAADDASADAKGGPCTRVLEGPRTCTDRATASGRDYRLSPKSSGTYTVSVNDTSGASVSMCVRISRDGDSLARECGEAGAPAVATAKLDLNTVDVHVEDTFSTKATATHPFTLTIASAASKDEASDARPFPAPLLAFPVLGLVFLVIPLVLTGEKSRIPRFIDPSGVTMRNGGHFPWQTYQGIRTLTEVTRAGTRHEVGVELVFSTGTALIRYRPITNQAEVFWITDQLKQGRNPFAG